MGNEAEKILVPRVQPPLPKLPKKKKKDKTPIDPPRVLEFSILDVQDFPFSENWQFLT